MRSRITKAKGKIKPKECFVMGNKTLMVGSPVTWVAFILRIA